MWIKRSQYEDLKKKLENIEYKLSTMRVWAQDPARSMIGNTIQPVPLADAVEMILEHLNIELIWNPGEDPHAVLTPKGESTTQGRGPSSGG